jgi:biopolymer transport protein TolR
MGMSSDGGGDLKSDINVTPLVDVMLVLLIIFMITAPMMVTGIELELPQGTVPQQDDDEEGLVLSIDRQRRVYLGEAEVGWNELRVKLETNERVQREQTLYIEADTSLPYGVVIAAMDTAQAAGVTRLMMRTDPVDEVRRQELLQGFEPSGEPAGGDAPNPSDDGAGGG